MYQLENVGFQNVKSAMRCFGAGELERCIVGPLAAIPRFLLLPYPHNGTPCVRKISFTSLRVEPSVTIPEYRRKAASMTRRFAAARLWLACLLKCTETTAKEHTAARKGLPDSPLKEAALR